MNKQTWQSVEALFDALSKLPPPERAARLSEIADEGVRREVASLLENMGDEAFLASVVGKMAAQIENPAQPDERIGPYKLVRRLARGGQGAVFEAIRDDGSFQQRVAIKMVKWEADSDESRRRFRAERQILAGLQHPNIARLLDGGETSDGTPYLVMEFIDGQPLNVAAGDWPLKRELDLFLQVADAVAFAHRNLIVHRDLKPANILVTSEGVPKLLDFGIAKLIDPEATRTQTGFIGLTPDYASPEQIRGLPISTVSDVYSLGVVLYQLLTGRKPYTLETATPLEMDRVIVNQPPAPPGLGDELDHILLMALRKEPERRYQSVEAFAEDVRRYLEHRPILARPDTIGYRARKYVRRHWIPVTTVTIAMAGVLGGAAVAVYQARVAQHRFDQVRKLANRFLFDFDKEIAEVPGTVKAREMIVSTALEYLGSLEQESRGDPQLRWELASAYAKVSEVQGSNYSPSLNHPKDAITSAQKALALARPIADRDGSVEHRTELVTMLRNLQAILSGLGEFDQSVKIGEEQVARSAGLSVAVQDNSAGTLATTYLWKGDLEKARVMYEQGLELSRQMAASDPSVRYRIHLAGSLREVGQVMWNLTRLEEARTLLSESIPMYRRGLQEQPANRNAERNLGISLDTLAQVLGSVEYPSLERPSEGEPYYAEFLGMLEKRLTADPKDRSTQHDLGAVLERAGADLIGLKPEKALAYTRRAVELRDASDDNPGEKAGPRVRLAYAYIALKQYGDAARRLEEAQSLVSPGDSENERDVYRGWMRLEQARGNRTQAANWCLKAVAAGEAALAAKPVPANALPLARILELGAQVKPDSAPAHRRRILEIWQDQNRRFPSAYLQQRVAEAERNQAVN